MNDYNPLTEEQKDIVRTVSALSDEAKLSVTRYIESTDKLIISLKNAIACLEELDRKLEQL